MEASSQESVVLVASVNRTESPPGSTCGKRLRLLPAISIEHGEDPRFTTRRWHLMEAAETWREHELVSAPVRSRGESTAIAADPERCASAHGGAVQRSALREGDPCIVGREKRCHPALAAFDRPRFEHIDPSKVDAARVLASHDIGEISAVPGNGERGLRRKALSIGEAQGGSDHGALRRQRSPQEAPEGDAG